MTRVVVVLGYSNGGNDALHPVCSARLAAASAISRPDDVVVLSGWARSPRARSEAALMAEAWRGPAAELVVDPDARTTTENLRNALGDVRRVAACEVVVVTSRWHAPRATAAMRWLTRSSEVRVRAVSPAGASRRDAARELLLWPLLPLQLLRARTRRA